MHLYIGQHLILLGPPHRPLASFLQSRHLKVGGLHPRHWIGCGASITHFKPSQQGISDPLTVMPQYSLLLMQISLLFCNTSSLVTIKDIYLYLRYLNSVGTIRLTDLIWVMRNWLTQKLLSSCFEFNSS